MQDTNKSAMVSETMQHRPATQDRALFAWMGWGMDLARDWRPLRFDGEWRRGAVVVGNGQYAVFQIKWWRPGTKRFDGGRWIGRRLGRKISQVQANKSSPQPIGFENTAWLPRRTSSGRKLGLWYGYAGRAGLVLEVVVNGSSPKDVQDEVEHDVLPSLRTWRPDEKTCVALFGANFKAPAGFRLQSWKLMLGDIALRFYSPEQRCTIVLRQVYPAALALARRRLERWLTVSPFEERRRLRAKGNLETVKVTVGRRSLPGLCRRGSKRLPFPLGGLAPLDSMAIVVHDTGVDRLLFAQVDSRDGTSKESVVQAIRGMEFVTQSGTRSP